MGLGETEAFAATDCARFYLDETPPALMGTVPGSTVETCFRHFAVLNASATLTALWSAEHLTAEDVKNGERFDGVDGFHPEDRLSSDQAASVTDYDKLDRRWAIGRLSPAEDAPDQLARTEASSLANAVPRAKMLDQHLWKYLEASMRSLARRDGELYIISGPIFFADPPRLHDRVAIPSYIYKAAYNPKSGQAIAYVAGNVNVPVCWVVSVQQLTQMSGIDPFPTLSAEVKANTKPWPLPSGKNLPLPDCTPAS